jgi:hypothetical protein
MRRVLFVVGAACSCGGIARGAADAGPSTPYVGVFSAGEGFTLNAGFFRTGTASFAPPTVASSCAAPVTVAGDCCYSPQVLDPPVLPTGIGAGTLTVADGSEVIGSLMPDAQGQYASTSGNGTPLWNAGDLLQVTVSGGEIDAFSASLQTPGMLMATPGAEQGIAIDRSQDFVTTWSPDAHPGETVTLYMTVGVGAVQSINCQASDAAGHLIVPAALLAHAPAEANVITNVYRVANAMAVASNASVSLTARTLVTWTGTIP